MERRLTMTVEEAAAVNTPAMAWQLVGLGSQYAGAMVDAAGQAFDGGAAYRLRLPADVPAKDFWSVVIYDPQTRSELQTGQPFPGRNSQRDELRMNDDGPLEPWFDSTWRPDDIVRV